MSAGRKPELELLVSTMNRSAPPDVLCDVAADERGPRLLVINQCTTQAPLPDLEGPWGRMLSFAERGLARSRNRALEATRASIAVLGDDDVTYLPSMVDTVQRAFAAHPDAAVITFQYLDADTRAPLKRYAKHAFRHGLRSIASVSSIEIALRPDRLRGVRFDPRFGLGAAHPSGEEAIFLADLLHAGCALYYWPEPLCLHPGAGSGHRAWTADVAEAKGAVFRRMYGPLWPPAAVYFALSKYPAYRSQLGIGRWLWHTTRGALEKP